MGLLSSLLGNASEIDIPKVQQEFAPVLVPGEVIGKGFKLWQDVLDQFYAGQPDMATLRLLAG